jgi:hypothetical protein
MGFLKRATREPLVHFLAIGAALFIVNGLINGPDEGGAGETVVISEGRVSQIAQSFVLLSGRAPTRAEIESLVDDFVAEEVGYREAVAMGLDADDTIVRRRMRQKLEFLIEDSAASDQPTQAEMRAWLDANAATYRLPERRALRQVLFSADNRGLSTGKDAAAALAQLSTGADPAKFGDRSMLPAAIPLTTEEGVASLFGQDFAAAAFAHQGKDWFGPVVSAFGQHLVTVIETEPGRAVTLSEAADRISTDIVESRRNAARDAFHARMRQRYEIHINWPDPWKDLPDTPDPNPQTRSIPEVGE